MVMRLAFSIASMVSPDILIVDEILKNMGLGALLAIIVLAVFLKDMRPTFLVAIAIPLSVLFAVVLMYFSNLSLNIMTLSGLGLGIGMLVDNSIVVIENIFQWPGVGVWFTDAIKTQNTPIIMSVGLFMVLMVLLSSLLVDILTAVLDPRVKLS